ncbi:hypothetical protein VNI00_000120 [Paramarasmius palmivorus]|uniref:CLASP N-terminal domain-containing protein n=1 Tax=Paramarasmius palmivorus TaxID=297713 RepID=A0AAW0EEQ6_9AGAR
MTSEFLQDFAAIRHHITLPETEESWDTIAKSISKLSDLIHNGMPNEIVSVLRDVSRNITNALRSERTRLCGPAMELITAVSAELGMSFEPLLAIYFPVLLALCARTNKVIVNKARATVFAIIENVQLSGVLPYLLQNIKDKSTSLRLVVADGIAKENRSTEIETIIKATSRDANADVRKAGKKAFMKYKVVLPNRVDTSEKPQPHPLSSSTSAVPSNRTAGAPTIGRPERPISVPPPSSNSTAAINPNPNTLTASQRDAIKASMAGVPKRLPPSSTSNAHSNAMPPPTMPMRPARSGHSTSNSTSTTLQGAPDRPTHSRTTSQSAVNGSSAPVRLPAPPMRAEKGHATAPSGQPAPPPPQRFAVSSHSETSRERNAGPKKPELPKLQPEPAPRARTRTMSMKNLQKPAASSVDTGARVDNSKSTTAVPSGSSAPSLNRSKSTAVITKAATKPASSSAADAQQKPTTATAKSGAPNLSKSTTTSKPAPAHKSSTTTSKPASTIPPSDKPQPAPKPRVGLTAPTAASQSRMQAKKSVPNLKAGSTATTGAARSLQTKKSIATIRAAASEKEIPRPKSRARTVHRADEIKVVAPPSRREQMAHPPSQRLPAGKEDQASRPPSRHNEDDEQVVAVTEVDSEHVANEAEVAQSPEEPSEPTPEDGDVEGTSPEVQADQVTPSNNEEKEDQSAPAINTPQIITPDPQTPAVSTTKKLGDQSKTPISALLLSIEEGFMFSPGAPLSPAEKYLNMPTNLEGGFRFGVPGPLFTKADAGEKAANEGREALGELGNQ